MFQLAVLNTRFTSEALSERVIQVVARTLDVETDKVTLDMSLQKDLGAESLDYLDIAFSLEREYKVHFPRQDLLMRAAAYFGEDNLVKDGVVSELGLRMLRHAMPEIDPEMLRPGLQAAAVPALFTVGTFVRVLDRLLAAKDALSLTCPKCGAEMQESRTLPELACPSCQATVPYASGDDVMFQELVRLSKQES